MNIQVNDCVTILGHVGIIDDIATSEQGRTLILWCSLKGIWNHHPQEWIDVTDTIEHIKPSTKEDIHKDRQYYLDYCIHKAGNDMVNLGTDILDSLSLSGKGE